MLAHSLYFTSLFRFALLTYTPIFFSHSYARYTVDDDVTRRSMSGGVKIGCQIVLFSFCGRATFIPRSREFQSKIKHKSAQGDTFWMTLFLSLSCKLDFGSPFSLAVVLISFPPFKFIYFKFYHYSTTLFTDRILAAHPLVKLH